jgi:hypothetical protein
MKHRRVLRSEVSDKGKKYKWGKKKKTNCTQRLQKPHFM